LPEDGDELEVSTKTIQRDIDFMRDRMGLPIEYDQLQFGFFYTEPVTNFPSIEVSEGEVLALFVARKALAQYKGTSFEKRLEAAFRKLTDGLKDTFSFSWTDVEEGISFRNIGATVADLEVFEEISKAVLQRRELSFSYKKLQADRFVPRRIRPYHLGCIENQWYVIGYDLERKQLRTFALPRMRQVRASSERFQRPADFSVEQLLGQSFGVFSGNGRHRIRLRFDAFAGQLVGERQWHASQKIEDTGKDEIEMTLELGSFEEIERWILSWGSHVQVLEPKELVERIRKTAGGIGDLYSPERRRG